MLTRILSLLICFVFFTKPLNAQDNKIYLIDTLVNCNFIPEQAFFLVDIDKQRAVYTAALNELEVSNTKHSSYVALLALELKQVPESFNAVLYAAAENGKFCFQVMPGEGKKDFVRRLNLAASLRTDVAKERTDLGALNNELNQAQKDLTRLKKDASAIGKLGRIALKEEELKILQEKSDMLAQDIERLNGFLQQASQQTSPRSFVRRQTELTSQLEELAKSGRLVEDAEQQRKQFFESDLQRTLALIEETRYENSAELSSQLQQLREARLRLEARSAVGTRANEPVESYLP